ncbi:MAG: rane protein required for colicin production [Acidobacteriota bacterium]|nr:rane protein required for colicin production [Acidobacteriota bacterium]
MNALLESLSILDIVFLSIVGISVVLGIIKGFIRELFSLVFLIIGGVLAFLFYKDVGKSLMKYVKNENLTNFMGFIIIFAGVLIVGAFITYAVRKIFTFGPLKSVDRILGGVFGLVRGILVSAVIVLVFLAFPFHDEWLTNSKIAPYLVDTIRVVVKWFPKSVTEKMTYIDRIDMNKGRKHD